MQIIQNIATGFFLWIFTGWILTAILYVIYSSSKISKYGDLIFKIGIIIGGPAIWVTMWLGSLGKKNLSNM